MVDLKAKPFFLNEQEIQWVENTIASMSLEEKLSQLFVLLKPVPGADENAIRSLMESAKPGGMERASLTRCRRQFQIRTGDGGALGKRALHIAKIYSFSAILVIA